MIEFKSVSKKYNSKNEQEYVLRDISFKIPMGGIVGVVGKNGAGKSTLLSIAATVIEDFRGEVFIKGCNIKEHLGMVRSIIGYVPQKPILFEELTVKDNLDFWIDYSKNKRNNKNSKIINNINNTKIEGNSKDNRNDTIRERLIKDLELEPWMRKKVKHLSGGTQNRLNIAVGLINNPEIIILDEPLVGISLSIKKNFFQLLKELSMQGKSIIMSSHEMDGILNLCTHLLVLKDSGIVFYDDMIKVKQICKKEQRNIWDFLCDIGGI